MDQALTLPERLLRRDRAVLVATLFGLTLVAWLYLVILARDMAAGDMRWMGMGTMDPAMMGMVMPMAWNAATFVLMTLMWWIMMIGMMLPGAAPMVLLFARVQRRNLPGDHPGLPIALFTSGYLLIWLAFSLAATLVQWTLGSWDLLLPMMKTASPVLGAAIFALAGLYQLTPLKRACLTSCQNPLQFLTRRWQTGHSGALRMGLLHGAVCVGCCWALMLLLFAGGVMNLLWVAALAAVVLLEKLLPPGRLYSYISGAVLLGVAVALLRSPA